MAIFDDSLVLEPGDVGPLPFSHPVAAHLIRAINEQRLSAGLLSTLRELGAPFYDGSVVLGVVDYRRWAFGGVKLSGGGATATPVASAGESTTTPTAKNGMFTPEMHKILLRAPYELLVEDLITVLNDPGMAPIPTGVSPKQQSKRLPPFAYPTEVQLVTDNYHPSTSLLLDIESKVLLATSPPLCLNPSPMVTRVLTTINYDINKFRAHLREPSLLTSSMGERRAREAAEVRSARIDAFRQMIGLAPRLHQQRFHLLATIEEQRHQIEVNRREPLYGLDARKDPSRLKLTAPPALTWLAPHDSLWRTMRFEQRSDQQRPLHVTAHLVITNMGTALSLGTAAGLGVMAAAPPPLPPSLSRSMANNINVGTLRFIAIIRVGTQPCWADISERRILLSSKGAAEALIDQLKMLMTLEGKSCVADVSNPNAMSSLIRTTTAAAASSTAGATTTTTTSSSCNNMMGMSGIGIGASGGMMVAEGGGTVANPAVPSHPLSSASAAAQQMGATNIHASNLFMSGALIRGRMAPTSASSSSLIGQSPVGGVGPMSALPVRQTLMFGAPASPLGGVGAAAGGATNVAMLGGGGKPNGPIPMVGMTGITTMGRPSAAAVNAYGGSLIRPPPSMHSSHANLNVPMAQPSTGHGSQLYHQASGPVLPQSLSHQQQPHPPHHHHHHQHHHHSPHHPSPQVHHQQQQQQPGQGQGQGPGMRAPLPPGVRPPLRPPADANNTTDLQRTSPSA